MIHYDAGNFHCDVKKKEQDHHLGEAEGIIRIKDDCSISSLVISLRGKISFFFFKWS